MTIETAHGVTTEPLLLDVEYRWIYSHGDRFCHRVTFGNR
jgi:hypothetical protein